MFRDTHIKTVRYIAPVQEPVCEGEVENNDEKVENFTEDEATEVDVVSESDIYIILLFIHKLNYLL